MQAPAGPLNASFIKTIPSSELNYHQPLGKGGFGIVYKAVYLTNEVAVKEISPLIHGDLFISRGKMVN
jgi:hypothetical protein